jgi:hypothetical protein
MSIDTVEQWSTTAASNTTLGATLTLDGAVMKPSEVDNAFRELMAQVATFNVEPTFANGIDFTSSSQFVIKPTTIDGADSAAVWILGGGAATTARGAIVIAYGNEGLSPGNIRLIPGTTAATGVSVEGAMTVTGTLTPNALSILATPLNVTFTDDGSSGPFINLSHVSTTPAVADIPGAVRATGRDSGLNSTIYGQLFWQTTNVTDTTEAANFVVQTMSAGTLTSALAVTGTGINNTAIGATTPGTGAFTTLTGTTIRLTSTITWTQGTGSPEGVVTAAVGSLFSRTDAATTLYVKQTGAGNTGWVAK